MMNRIEILMEIEREKENYRKHTTPYQSEGFTNGQPNLSRFAEQAMAKLEAYCRVMNIFTPRHEEIWSEKR
jgi:hypothetical protein